MTINYNIKSTILYQNNIKTNIIISYSSLLNLKIFSTESQKYLGLINSLKHNPPLHFFSTLYHFPMFGTQEHLLAFVSLNSLKND